MTIIVHGHAGVPIPTKFHVFYTYLSKNDKCFGDLNELSCFILQYVLHNIIFCAIYRCNLTGLFIGIILFIINKANQLSYKH